jgi:hypothetical protein
MSVPDDYLLIDLFVETLVCRIEQHPPRQILIFLYSSLQRIPVIGSRSRKCSSASHQRISTLSLSTRAIRMVVGKAEKTIRDEQVMCDLVFLSDIICLCYQIFQIRGQTGKTREAVRSRGRYDPRELVKRISRCSVDRQDVEPVLSPSHNSFSNRLNRSTMYRGNGILKRELKRAPFVA